MKQKQILSIALILLVWQSLSWAKDVSKIGTSAAPFLQIGVGSRASALGEAFTGIADNATGIYWNPSGIDRYSNNDASFNYSDWFAGMKFFNAAGVIHLGDIGSFGISVTSFSTEQMVVRTVAEPEGIGTRFNAADLAMGITYAKNLTDRFSFGATFKYISRRIWHMNADAVAMDFGIMYTLPWKQVTLGMSILNFGTKLQMQGVDAVVFTDIDPTITGNNTQIMANLYTKEWSLPLNFRFGLAYDVFDFADNKFKLAADYIHPNDNFSSVNIGGEYNFMNIFFIRAGYKSLMLEEDVAGLTFGGGINYNFIGIDYSYVKMKYFDYTQQFSLNVKF